MRIALTGGIACGKSLLVRYLKELGVETLDADDVVHRLEATGGDAVVAISEAFGASVLNPDGSVNRVSLAGIVFGDEDARRKLEGLLFPMVKRELLAFSDSVTGNGTLKIVVIPLLFESHWNEDYDIICCVASDKGLQVRRMIETRGYSEEEAEARLAVQIPVVEKSRLSDYVIENNKSPEALRDEAEKFVSWLKERIHNGRS